VEKKSCEMALVALAGRAALAAKRRVGAFQAACGCASQYLYSKDTGDNDESQHHRVFDRSWPFFGREEATNVMHGRSRFSLVVDIALWGKSRSQNEVRQICRPICRQVAPEPQAKPTLVEVPVRRRPY
jgi:hypothetical protein